METVIKYIRKFGMLFIIGIIVAIILYPLIHELGHALTAILVGADVVEINLFPVPNILCNLKGVGSFEVTLIGFGGSMLPFLLTIYWEPKNFEVWYSCFMIRGISFLSFVISFVSVILFVVGNPVVNEDITQVLMITPYMAPLYGILCVLLASIQALVIIRSKPLQRCEKFIE